MVMSILKFFLILYGAGSVIVLLLFLFSIWIVEVIRTW